MNQRIIIFLMALTFGSCIEELDLLESNFEKVYGLNRSADPFGIYQNSDGTYLIFGRAQRTIQDFKNFSRENRAALMPIIIKIDQNGNEIITRTYPIEQLKYEYGLFPGTYNVDVAHFSSVIEMKNGNYFATFFGYDENDWVEGYMILDENLEVEKIRLFGDSELEFENTLYIARSDFQVLKSASEKEILLLAERSYYLDSNYYVKPETGFYSIYRMSFDGDIIQIYDFDSNSFPLSATDLAFDDDGKALVVGRINNTGEELFVHKIDIEDGEILNKMNFNDGLSRFTSPKVQSTVNGYVISEIQTSVPDNVFSLRFLDQDLNFSKRVSHPVDYTECYIRSFIAMQSGGFSALSFSCNGPMSIYRLDEEGNLLWRMEREIDANDGILSGRIIEAADGGVLFLGGREFNSTGHKMVLIKLDANGNFQ